MALFPYRPGFPNPGLLIKSDLQYKGLEALNYPASRNGIPGRSSIAGDAGAAAAAFSRRRFIFGGNETKAWLSKIKVQFLQKRGPGSTAA